ncbi:MAG: BTAD domain-containing putative transcriptional regulator [Burkholderiales bacterium]
MQTLAKLTPPKLSNAYPRERLFAKLDEFRKSPVVWICGPPGAGKTTLVASYLAERKLKPLWYRLDEGDADPATLFYYLGVAAKQAAPRKNKPLPLFTPEYLQGLPAFTRRYFRELYERLSHAFVVVFDNYQDVGAETRVHEVMQHALDEIPPQGNVVIISRVEPPQQLARLRVNRMLQVVGPEQMRLSLEESSGIANTRNAAPFSEHALKQLNERTQGWAAGVTLLCELGGKAAEVSHAGAERQTVFDYFAGEIFQTADRKMQDFLMETAFLPSLTGAMAEQLTAHRDAERILAELAVRNYFTLRDGASPPAYQYHPLFREFLLTRARASFTETRLHALMRDAARLLASAGQPEPAAELLRESGDWEGLTKLIFESAQALTQQGRVDTVKKWLDSLPNLDASPWLTYWYGECLLVANPRESWPYFERSLNLFREEKNVTGIYLSWIGLAFSIRLEPTADLRPLDQWIAVFDELRREYPEYPSPEIEVAATACMLLVLLMRQPHNPNMRKWGARAISLLKSGLPAVARVELGTFLLIYHDLMGNFAEATIVRDLVRASAAETDVPIILRIYRAFAQTFHCWSRSMFDESLAHLREGLGFARESGVHVWDHMLLAHGLYATLTSGNLKVAKELMEELSTRYPDWSNAHYTAALYTYLENDLSLALVHAEASVQAAEREGRPYLILLCHGALGQVLRQLGDLKKSRHHCDKYMSLAREIGSPFLLAPGHLQQALLELDEGEHKSACNSLRAGFSLCRENGYSNWPWSVPEHLSRLCAEALKAGIEVEYVRKLVKLRRLRSPALDMENWPWPIRIFTLGRFQVLINDQPLTFSTKAPKKPIALLKAVIAFGAAEVPERKLTDALWGDEEGDAAHEALNVNVHRLRKLLGDVEAIQVQEGKVTLDAQRCWIDALAFERLLNQATSSVMSERAALSEKVLALYRGAFLPEESEAPWSVSMREKLRAQFIRHSAQLARKRSDAGELEQAIECYLRGLEADDLAEELYQGAIRCYQQLNRRAEALAVYRRMRQTLSVTLGIKPSPTSEALYRSLSAE